MTLTDGISRMQKEIQKLQKEGKQKQAHDLKMIYFVAFKHDLSELNSQLDEESFDVLVDDYEKKHDKTLSERYF